jgi:ectoine hydroxylase-related dioxygenase (phytanoyl-CoA dioxygenase family)
MDENGFCIIPSVLKGDELARVREAYDRAIATMKSQGIDTYSPLLDPNAQNIRVNNLPDFDPVFVELLRHPIGIPVMREVLGPDGYVSNFTANTALPGAKSMKIHSDQALLVPPPWLEPWAMNLIWCLDDVHEANGATRYLPGSHRFKTFEDVPPDASSKTLPFIAPAGSVVAMEGRLWHTSGANVTKDQPRSLLFALYSRGFVRAQVSWEITLSDKTKAGLDQDTRELMGMVPLTNAALAFPIIDLRT